MNTPFAEPFTQLHLRNPNYSSAHATGSEEEFSRVNPCNGCARPKFLNMGEVRFERVTLSAETTSPPTRRYGQNSILSSTFSLLQQ